MSKFSDKLINLRESHDWSKTYVANHIGLKNMQTYANWEYGKSEPDQGMLKELANLFDVSTDYLLGNTDKKHYYDLTEKDKKDAAEQVEDVINGMSSDINFYGEPMTDEERAKLKASLQMALEITKSEAKKKFTPKKYRDGE